MGGLARGGYARFAAVWFLNFAIAYHVIVVTALLATGGFEIELFGISRTSNRLFSPLLGLVLSVALRSAVAIGWLNSLLVGVSVAFALGLCEIALRVLEPPLAQPASLHILRPSQQFGHEHTPSVSGYGNLGERVSINSYGARDHEFADKRADTRRVVAVGDSFTFGFGVELDDAYVKLLEAALSDRFERIEVLNLGVSAYQTWQILEVMQQRVPPLKPDLVIVGFFMDDMIEPVKPTSINASNPAQIWLDGKVLSSRLWNMLRNVGGQLEFRIRHQRGQEYLRSVAERQDYVERRLPLHYALQTGRIDTETKDRILRAISRFADWSNATGIDLFTFYIPDASQVNRPDLQFINRLLADGFAQHGIGFLDLTPTFEAHGDVRQLYLLPVDAHTNRLGNQLIAETLAADKRLLDLLEE